MNVVITNHSSVRAPLAVTRSVCLSVLKKFELSVTISVVFVSEKEIQYLNRTYRDCNVPTDILSFSYHDDDCYGELVVCPVYVKRTSVSWGISVRETLEMLLIHGMLHLVGYTHDTGRSRKEMEQIERELLSLIRSDIEW